MASFQHLSLRFTILAWLLLIQPGTIGKLAFADDQSHQSLIVSVRPSVLTIRVRGRDGESMGIGTGFVIDAQGLIATNHHVISEGREFSVELNSGRRLKVLAVEASDVASDLAIIRVDPENHPLQALDIAPENTSEQGLRVLAFGNPLGLKDSVVEGIISAKREVEGRELLQLAMPIEPGNSGGPLVDLKGRVHGIVNMKSAIDDNLGFAIPVEQLVTLRDRPNPVAIDRWVRIGTVNPDRWTSVAGARWQQHGGRITASGLGTGFGGRSLLLSKSEAPEVPYEIAVMVRLDDESGAAGLVFHSDGQDRHYGFYPSAGKLRLTCFLGPSVYSWQILQDVATDHYLPGQWNQLKVRVDAEKFSCYVNGQLVIESTDRQLTDGSFGLAKFRDTVPEFSGFQFGREIVTPRLSESASQSLATLDVLPLPIDSIGQDQIQELGTAGELSARELTRRAISLESQAKQLRQLADDVRRAGTIDQLIRLKELDESVQLLTGALLIAKLDHADLDIDSYISRVDEMSTEIQATIAVDADQDQIRDAMHHYLFDENGFHGSRSEYYHTANSHLNRVIDDREGLPITLSILYIELGRRLGLRIEGVGLPGHFVVRHRIDETHEPLIDVFERGKQISRDEAEEIVVSHSRRVMLDADLQPVTTFEILTRVLNNLIGIAGNSNDGEAMLRYADAIVALNPETSSFRMMRAQLRGMTGRIQLALADIESLLNSEAPGLDVNAAERLRDALIERVGSPR